MGDGRLRGLERRAVARTVSRSAWTWRQKGGRRRGIMSRSGAAGEGGFGPFSGAEHIMYSIEKML